MSDLQLKIHAHSLRRRFVDHTKTVRDIVNEMSDLDLVKAYHDFERERLYHFQQKLKRKG